MARDVADQHSIVHIRYNFPLRRIFYFDKALNEHRHSVWLAPDDFYGMLRFLKDATWSYRVLYAVKATLKP